MLGGSPHLPRGRWGTHAFCFDGSCSSGLKIPITSCASERKVMSHRLIQDTQADVSRRSSGSPRGTQS